MRQTWSCNLHLSTGLDPLPQPKRDTQCQPRPHLDGSDPSNVKATTNKQKNMQLTSAAAVALKRTLLVLLAAATVAAGQVPGQAYRLPRKINAASTPVGARLVQQLRSRHNMEDMQAWNQDTMRACQLNEIRVLQAGTTVMVEKIQGDLTVFRVGKNPTEL